MYLFDTNILSETLKKKPSEHLLKRLSGLSGSVQFTSCICVMELRYGAARRKDFEAFWGRLERELLAAIGILPITVEIAMQAGDIAAGLSLRGLGVPAEDVLIAATALQGDMMLVTANTKHFDRVPGLKLENWLLE